MSEEQNNIVTFTPVFHFDDGGEHEIRETIAQAVEQANIATTNANTAAENCRGTIGDDFSPLVHYAGGSYVWYDNVLYMFTSPHFGAWTGEDVTPGKIANDLTAFKNQTSGTLENLNTRVTRAETDIVATSIINTAGPAASVSFQDGSNRGSLKAVVKISPTQTGSGTPSLDNVRPIVTISSVGITIKPDPSETGATTTIALEQNVAGGTITVNRDGTGELEVTHFYSVLDGTENWAIQQGQNGNPNYLRATKDGNDNRYPAVTSTSTAKFTASVTALPTSNNDTVGMYMYTSSGNTYPYVYARLADMTNVTAESWKTQLAELNTANTPMAVVYKLATPQTYPLTATQIKTLLGANFISTNVGVISVEYSADPKYYTDELNYGLCATTDISDSFIDGKYFDLSGPVGSTVNVLAIDSNYCRTQVACKAGDQFTLTASTEQEDGAIIWAFTDEDRTILSKAAVGANANNLVLTAEQDGYFYANALVSSTHSLLIYTIHPVAEEVQSLTALSTATTNALSKRSALNYGAATTIEEETDYDELTTPGNYKCTSQEHASTMIHGPGNASHRLFVYETTSGNLVQIAFVNVSSGVQIKYRSKASNASTWTPSESWHSVVNQKKLDALEASLTGGDIPDYYYDNGYLNDRISEIISKRNTYGTRSPACKQLIESIFITDPHFYRNTVATSDNGLQSVKLIKNIIDKTNIDHVVCGGDMTNGDTMTNAQCRTLFSAIREHMAPIWNDTFMCVGNHEWNNPSASAAQEVNQTNFIQIFNGFISDKTKCYTEYETDLCCYCVDDAVNKLRTYYLGCTRGGTMTYGSFKWFFNSVINTPEGYSILVYSHIALKRENGVAVWIDQSFEPFVNLLNAAKNGLYFAYNWKNTSWTGTHDFKNDTYDVVGIISGHIHLDLSKYTTEAMLANFENGSLLEWYPITSYVVGDIVKRTTVDGEITTATEYKCIEANTDVSFNADHWDKVLSISTGKTWAEWAANTTYAVGARIKVTNGSTITYYVCNYANTDSVFNSNHWDVYAFKSFPVISTTCDRSALSTSSDLLKAARVKGTISEQAFDVVQIDMTNRTIDMTRIGGSTVGSAYDPVTGKIYDAEVGTGTEYDATEWVLATTHKDRSYTF